jgi:Putative redox-active protein (C_GCAxxG_C_C)
MQHGYQCGMIWGAALAAGAEAYRRFGAGPRAQTAALLAAQRLIKAFVDDKNTINCLEITEIDKSSTTKEMIMFFLLKGGTIGCIKMASKYAPTAYDEIQAALGEDINVLSSPVSCAAMLAQRVGLSEEHQAMLAGYAGGIGLSGGACGALGAAIWINGLKRAQEPDSKIDLKDPDSLAKIEKFLKVSDYKFDCSEIVGRKFEDVEDHACYMRDGGCSAILDVLAAEESES